MPMCKFCGVAFGWGNTGERWVPLVPGGEEGDLLRDYVDADGVLRSSHRQICNRVGGETVRVTKLKVPFPAEQVLPAPAIKPEFSLKRKRKPKTAS